MNQTIPIEVDDVQALVFRGHGDFPHSEALWLSLADAAAARGPLRTLVTERVCFGRGRPGEVHPRAQLLFSAEGLRLLGAAGEAVEACHRPFAQGMTAPQRVRTLGDAGRNHPDGWRWSDRAAHVLVLIYAPTAEAARAEAGRVERALSPDCAVMHKLTTQLPVDEREPFGFRDGLARTFVRVGDGSDRGPAEDVLPPGEVVLGYRDATGEEPTVHDLFLNGSFVVVRQLEQDVRGFWQFWREQADGDDTEAVWLAAKALGRWPNGMPVRSGPPGPEPALDEEVAERPLAFQGDPHGTGCPIGSHVRRANPRDALVPDVNVSRDVIALHRMMRRGRTYGTVPPPDWYPRGQRREDPALGPTLADDEKGLLFVSLCGDISRQFEFIQQSWLNHPKHADLQDETDPIAGGDGIAGNGCFFSVPTDGIRRRVGGVKGWVTVRGGGYFLMPGRRALRTLLAADELSERAPL